MGEEPDCRDKGREDKRSALTGAAGGMACRDRAGTCEMWKGGADSKDV